MKKRDNTDLGLQLANQLRKRDSIAIIYDEMKDRYGNNYRDRVLEGKINACSRNIKTIRKRMENEKERK